MCVMEAWGSELSLWILGVGVHCAFLLYPAPSSRLEQGIKAVIRVVGVITDSPRLCKGRAGRHRTAGGGGSAISIEKWSICVSSTVALAGLSDSITEEAVSCESAGKTPLGLEW